MAPQLYDVFVVGPLDASPAGAARLAESLARPSGRPVDVIARALGSGRLRVGNGVTRDVADTIAREMHGHGGRTSIVPSAGAAAALAAAPATPPIADPFSPPGLPAAVSAPAGGPARFSLTPLGANVARGNTPVSSPTLRPLAAHAHSPAHDGRGETVGLSGVPQEVHDPDSVPSEPPSGISSFALPETPAPSDPFSVPHGVEPSLELSRTSHAIKPRNAHQTLAGASALNTDKIVATSAASGLKFADDETDGGVTERCQKHGLLYDRRRFKGCRKCLDNKRGRTVRTESSIERSSPARRAFLGVAVGLVLGGAPAVYYAMEPGMAEVRRLRAEQRDLSEKPGTPEVLRAFDALDNRVSSSHFGNMRNTMLIWLVAGGVVFAGVYRLS